MVWALDQADQKGASDLRVGNVTPDQQSNADQLAHDQKAKITCTYAGCGQKCPKGSSLVAESNGQPGQLSTSPRCPKGKREPLCCDHGTTVGKCQWRGFRGAGLSCLGGCADGETEVATNTNSYVKGDRTCNGGLQSFCCAGFSPAPTKQELEQRAKDAAKAAAEAAAANAALDLAAKAFCRVAVPALLAPLELAEDLIPIIGEILNIAEIAATPALINLCVKGIEKEGKAEFKVFGKKHTLSFNQPKKPPQTRPPPSSHEKPKTSSQPGGCSRGRGKLRKRAPCNHYTTFTAVTTTTVLDSSRTCVARRWPQACWHYSSVIHNNPAFGTLTCSEYAQRDGPGGTATSVWSTQHNTDWRPWLQRSDRRCQRDEWPPLHFWQGRGGQLIRYNVSVLKDPVAQHLSRTDTSLLQHAEDNTGAGRLWQNFCPEHAASRCEAGSEQTRLAPNGRSITTSCRKLLTLSGQLQDPLENTNLADQ